MSLPNKKPCWFYLFSSFLLGAVFVLISIQVAKYVRGDTTIAYRTEDPEVLPFPVVSFCPGFKPDAADNFLEFVSADNDEETEAAWDKLTFSLEDLVKHVALLTPSGMLPHKVVPPASSTECLKIQKLDTYSGKCYSIVVTCPDQSFWVLAAKFKLQDVYERRLNLYVHHYLEDAPFGFNRNFWLFPTAMVEIHHLQKVDVVMKKTVRIARSGAESGKDTVDCVKNFMLGSTSAVVNTSLLCRSPRFRSLFDLVPGIAELPGLEPCRGMEDSWRGVSAAEAVIQQMGPAMKACRGPKERVSYQAEVREATPSLTLLNLDGGNVTRAFFAYDDGSVYLEEEYVLLDFGGMLSAVGGLVGMFLGWSLLHVAEVLEGVMKKLSTNQ